MWTTHSVKSNNFILCPNKETGNVTSDAFIVTSPFFWSKLISERKNININKCVQVEQITENNI